MTKKVLVVIPTLNEAPHVAGIINAIARDQGDNETAIVVADGGSQDGTIEIVQKLTSKFNNLRLLHNLKRFQSAGINMAVEQYGSDADVLVRYDAHCGYPRNYVADLLKSLENTNSDAVVVPMDSRGETCLQKAIAWLSDSKLGSGGSAHRGGSRSGFVEHGHHAAMRVASFRRAGGYDESFSHNEDAEFDCRLRAVSGRIFLDSEIRLTYWPRSSLLGLARQYFNYGRGRSRTARKHPGSMRLRQIVVPAHVGLTMLAIMLFPLQPLFLLWPATYLAALTAAAGILSARHRSLCAVLAAPAALVMHVAWAGGFFWGMLTIREATWELTPEANAVSEP